MGSGTRNRLSVLGGGLCGIVILLHSSGRRLGGSGGCLSSSLTSVSRRLGAPLASVIVVARLVGSRGSIRGHTRFVGIIRGRVSGVR